MDARVNITIPQDFLRQVDTEARREHRSRSELIREALRLYLAVPDESRTREKRHARALMAARRQEQIAVKVGKVDVVAAIRSMREER